MSSVGSSLWKRNCVTGYLHVQQQSCHSSGHSRHILNVLCVLQSALARSRYTIWIHRKLRLWTATDLILYVQMVCLFSRLLLDMYVDSESLCVCLKWARVIAHTLCWHRLVYLMALTFTHNPVRKTWHLCWKSFISPHLWTLLSGTFFSLLRPLTALLTTISNKPACFLTLSNLYYICLKVSSNNILCDCC